MLAAVRASNVEETRRVVISRGTVHSHKLAVTAAHRHRFPLESNSRKLNDFVESLVCTVQGDSFEHSRQLVTNFFPDSFFNDRLNCSSPCVCCKSNFFSGV